LTMLNKGLWCILLIFVSILVRGLITAADRPVLKKTDLPRLGDIPREASIIVAAPWAGEKTALGRPMNELFAVDDQGGHKTRITFNGKSYNHFAVSPGRKMIAAILSGAYGGVVASQTAHLFGGAWPELGVFLVAALAVHLFTVFFRKAVSPSEVLVLLFLVGALILWQ